MNAASLLRLRRGRTLLGWLTGATAGLIRRGDAARRERRFRDAAILYQEALRLDPENAGIRIQCGHMFKEAGDYVAADRHYTVALRLRPTDPDLALQLGHFNKIAGHSARAIASYARAAALRPGCSQAEAELAQLRAAHGIDLADTMATLADGEAEAGVADLAPELAPRVGASALLVYDERIEVRRIGSSQRSAEGVIQTLRGVEAIRGFVISDEPVAELRVTLDDAVLHSGPLGDGIELPGDRAALRKYVFNIWIDFGRAPRGRAMLALCFLTTRGRARVRQEAVLVAEPRAESDHPASDAILALPPDDHRPVAVQVNARPSMARDATRRFFDPLPRTILVQRVDQLGDLVTSVPGIRRLREIFPDARFVGLLSAANRELALSLGLFDAVEIADFPDDPQERRRVMTMREQVRLRTALRAYAIDLAIDLSDSGVSRPLLFLAGAPLTAGFRPKEFAWLSTGFETVTHDAGNALECAPHSAKLMGFVEWLGVLARNHARIERDPGLDRGLLAEVGLRPQDRFVVFHTGARLAFSRWPHYAALARIILAETDLRVVMLTDELDDRSRLPSDLLADPRFTLVDRRPRFAVFDALVSFCDGFVGNDSGPKHLAGLRGANVVSLHMARNNWSEWGQEGRGIVMSRKVPCAGCALHHEPEECGKSFACIAEIKPAEVFAALRPFLESAPGTPAARTA